MSTTVVSAFDETGGPALTLSAKLPSDPQLGALVAASAEPQKEVTTDGAPAESAAPSLSHYTLDAPQSTQDSDGEIGVTESNSISEDGIADELSDAATNFPGSSTQPQHTAAGDSSDTLNSSASTPDASADASPTIPSTDIGATAAVASCSSDAALEASNVALEAVGLNAKSSETLVSRTMRLAFKAAAMAAKPPPAPVDPVPAVVEATEPAKPQSKWRAIAIGFALASKVSSKAASKSSGDLNTSLQDSNARFTTSFLTNLSDAVHLAQNEIFAAKVPMAAHGRIRDALEKLKNSMNNTTNEMLTSECVLLPCQASSYRTIPHKRSVPSVHGYDVQPVNCWRHTGSQRFGTQLQML